MTTEETHVHTSPRNGSITAGLTTGIIGTALGALNTLGSGNGLFGFGGRPFGGPAPEFVTKEEFKMNSQLMSKDAEIADLKSQNFTNIKIVDTYKELAHQINILNDKVDSNRDRGDDRLATAIDKVNCKIDRNKDFQDGINAQQLAYNSTNSCVVNCLKSQVEAIVTPVVKNSAICPGWGTVTISPSLSA